MSDESLVLGALGVRPGWRPRARSRGARVCWDIVSPLWATPCSQILRGPSTVGFSWALSPTCNGQAAPPPPHPASSDPPDPGHGSQAPTGPHAALAGSPHGSLPAEGSLPPGTQQLGEPGAPQCYFYLCT